MLLATNFPSSLDPAVLRRVPIQLHVGLPSLESRKSILNHFLRDEDLDNSVVLHELGEMTHLF